MKLCWKFEKIFEENFVKFMNICGKSAKNVSKLQVINI